MMETVIGKINVADIALMENIMINDNMITIYFVLKFIVFTSLVLI